MSHILVLNAGSSSLKFGLYEAAAEPRALVTGQVERIGGDAAYSLKDAEGASVAATDLGPDAARDHAGALETVITEVAIRYPGARIEAVGHRIVHGGLEFSAPTELTSGVIAALERFVPFAPLHQPHNLAGVRAALGAFPEARQIAGFDTAFHRGHPFVNDTFALPREFFDKGVRRYGFHGLSYDYVSGALAELAPTLASGRVVIAHLGNGASMCGLLDGRSIASSMGFSALDGLPMGTRPGQLDPGVLLYLMDSEKMSVADISDLLYRRSGLLGLSGISHDMRTLLASDRSEAREAVDYFCFRVRRELGGLAAALEGLDAVVFTGGIGENAAGIRARVCVGLSWIGIELDADRNARADAVISSDRSPVRVLVIPTHEELIIARAASRMLRGG